MNTTVSVSADERSSSIIRPALMIAAMGIALIFTVGHLQAETLHDAAHDVRHATGFPCH